MAMDTQFSPVTEQEVMTFAQRIATTIVGYSSQAQELEQVKGQVAQYQTEISHLRDENMNLNRTVGENNQLLEMYVKDLDRAKAAASELISKNRHFEELLVARDNRVAELARELDQTKQERDNLGRSYDTAKRQLEDAQNVLFNVRNERDRLHEEANSLRHDLFVAEADLRKIEEATASIFGRVSVERSAEAQDKPSPEMKPVIPLVEEPLEEYKPFHGAEPNPEVAKESEHPEWLSAKTS